MDVAAQKQSAWNKLVTTSEPVKLTNSLSSMADKARLLAMTVPHHSALPLPSCGYV